MTIQEQCCVSGCTEPASVLVETRPLCVPHFISISYDRIEQYGHIVTEHRLYEEQAGSMGQFLVDCIARAADLTQCAEKLDNLSRARLLDILLRAAELTRYLRRSSRRLAAIPIQLRCEKLGRAWDEETETRVLSRFGAMLECGHAVEAGDTLLVTRLDTGEQARGRIAWRKQNNSGRFEIGLELLNCENFWGFEWGGAEGFRPEPNWNIPSPQ